MNTTVPVKGLSGHIYRLRILRNIDDLPRTAGVYCFLPPLRYPGAPIEPVYWAAASFDLFVEVCEDPVRPEAFRTGATCIGVVAMEGRVARRRALTDLLKTLPARFNAPPKEPEVPFLRGAARKLS